MKDLVRSRHQIDAYYKMASQLKALSFQVSTIENSATVNSVLGSVGKTLGDINKTMDIGQVTRMIKEFGKQQMLMDLNQDMVSSLASVDERRHRPGNGRRYHRSRSRQGLPGSVCCGGDRIGRAIGDGEQQANGERRKCILNPQTLGCRPGGKTEEAEITVYSLMSIISVSYTHLTLPTNREV
eukprot:TRINITY_DN10868_c0_g3_i2.p1 TRINITY_DN10868_c0_g3~~TRINITY_DN10868_c0_g3_i2.p1  ORF type:complete len:183 (+),score=8.19 TRINITY_DN10868_c0_g3_i2:328-876(+)